jgi:MoxR-like ATPase
MSDVEAVAQLSQTRDQIYAEVGKAVIGQKQIVEELLIALLSGGHCLLVGVPGLAKTTLIQTIARTLDLSFGRIQFTPDLMPSDITGTDVLEEDAETGHKAFRFIRGPLFANIILADEINRTPPKTQAALLQAMQEHAVTAGGETMSLDEPFFVLATQNPIEQEGTYPLPEAQLDRFIFELWIDYPNQAEEEEIVRTTTSGEKAEVAKVINAQQIIALQKLVRRVPVAEHCIRYAVELVRASRPGEEKASDYIREMVNWGAGPRASQYLILAAKARTILAGRHSVAIDDIREVALPIMRHRIVVNFHAEAQNVSATNLIGRLLNDIVPQS